MTKDDIEIWDADNHMYEAPDASMRYLPERFRGALRYADVGGRQSWRSWAWSATASPTPPTR